MTSRFNEFDRSRIKTHEVSKQPRKVEIGCAAKVWKTGGTVIELLSSLPDILAGKDLKAVVAAIGAAHRESRPVLLAIGAHVIKCGLSPVIANLISRGIITGLALNGAGAIHDTEIALFGRTSEDVVTGLKEGSFGMGAETAEFVNSAAVAGYKAGLGFGESLGMKIAELDTTGSRMSLLAAASSAGIPATVHVALGTDIVHMHPSADGDAIGGCSMRDFLIFAAEVETIARQGGVLLNVGSAVVLPEVALKSFAMAINVGCSLENVTTINLDFIRQYRAEEQIVRRVRALGGKSISMVGHHEILLPIIAAALIESLEE